MAMQRRWVVESPSAHLKTFEAAISKTFMTTGNVCNCQTKSRNAMERTRRIHLRCNIKNPPCSALSMTKAARGKRKASVAGPCEAKCLTFEKFWGGTWTTVRYQQTYDIVWTYEHLPQHPSDFLPKDPKVCFS